MTKYRLQSLLFVFVAFMLGCNEYMIVGVLSDIAKEYHASLSSLGYTVTLFALIYAISTPIVTSLASRFNYAYPSRDFSHGMDRLTQRPFGRFFFWSALYF